MADWEEAAGISAPLYEIVDTVFELQSRGFFRRQACRALSFCFSPLDSLPVQPPQSGCDRTGTHWNWQ